MRQITKAIKHVVREIRDEAERQSDSSYYWDTGEDVGLIIWRSTRDCVANMFNGENDDV